MTLGCCGGNHSSNKNQHSQNVSRKTTLLTWLVGLGGIAGLIYLIN